MTVVIRARPPYIGVGIAIGIGIEGLSLRPWFRDPIPMPIPTAMGVQVYYPEPLRSAKSSTLRRHSAVVTQIGPLYIGVGIAIGIGIEGLS